MLSLVVRYSSAVLLCLALFVSVSVPSISVPLQAAELSGELKMWHRVTLSFEGPQTSETATPNPFTDYRLDVTFTNGADRYTVPGYYAADGQSANTSAEAGKIWRVHFAPMKTGSWQWQASFKQGAGVALADDGSSGKSTGFDGAKGAFEVAASDKTGRDIRAKGQLQYVGGHYPRFSGNGEYFLKQGPDAPENLLAYADFDGPFKSDGHKDNLIKTYQAHLKDWREGDPTWGKDNDKGKGLIGAVNYLASEGMNVISFLPMNIKGDDRNVFPYLNYDERFRIDCSRVDQWEVVLNHATRMGFFLHFKTQETENDQLLDGGDLGPERKFYYRELIARFGHHVALNWNLGEENTNTTEQVKAFCDFFEKNDPYGHLVVLHTYPNKQDQGYRPLLNYPSFDGLSIQTSRENFTNVHRDVARWVKASAKSDRKWVVACDEPGDASRAIRPDKDAGQAHINGRKNALWGTMLAGGWGCEWYFGYKHAHSDLTLQDFRSRDQWWDYCRYALEFFIHNEIPFTEMVNDNTRLIIDAPEPKQVPKPAQKPTQKPSKRKKKPAPKINVPKSQMGTHGYCFMKAGEVYVLFLKNASYKSELDLTGIDGDFAISWFDPRNGGDLQSGSVANVQGGGKVLLGDPPSDKNQDWAIMVAKK